MSPTKPAAFYTDAWRAIAQEAQSSDAMREGQEIRASLALDVMLALESAQILDAYHAPESLYDTQISPLSLSLSLAITDAERATILDAYKRAGAECLHLAEPGQWPSLTEYARAIFAVDWPRLETPTMLLDGYAMLAVWQEEEARAVDWQMIREEALSSALIALSDWPEGEDPSEDDYNEYPPGAVVEREPIQAQLWPDDTLLDIYEAEAEQRGLYCYWSEGNLCAAVGYEEARAAYRASLAEDSATWPAEGAERN